MKNAKRLSAVLVALVMLLGAASAQTLPGCQIRAEATVPGSQAGSSVSLGFVEVSAGAGSDSFVVNLNSSFGGAQALCFSATDGICVRSGDTWYQLTWEGLPLNAAFLAAPLKALKGLSLEDLPDALASDAQTLLSRLDAAFTQSAAVRRLALKLGMLQYGIVALQSEDVYAVLDKLAELYYGNFCGAETSPLLDGLLLEGFYKALYQMDVRDQTDAQWENMRSYYAYLEWRSYAPDFSLTGKVGQEKGALALTVRNRDVFSLSYQADRESRGYTFNGEVCTENSPVTLFDGTFANNRRETDFTLRYHPKNGVGAVGSLRVLADSYRGSASFLLHTLYQDSDGTVRDSHTVSGSYMETYDGAALSLDVSDGCALEVVLTRNGGSVHYWERGSLRFALEASVNEEANGFHGMLTVNGSQYELDGSATENALYLTANLCGAKYSLTLFQRDGRVRAVITTPFSDYQEIVLTASLRGQTLHAEATRSAYRAYDPETGAPVAVEARPLLTLDADWTWDTLRADLNLMGKPYRFNGSLQQNGGTARLDAGGHVYTLFLEADGPNAAVKLDADGRKYEFTCQQDGYRTEYVLRLDAAEYRLNAGRAEEGFTAEASANGQMARLTVTDAGDVTLETEGGTYALTHTALENGVQYRLDVNGQAYTADMTQSADGGGAVALKAEDGSIPTITVAAGPTEAEYPSLPKDITPLDVEAPVTAWVERYVLGR